MTIKRLAEEIIIRKMNPGKVVLLLGPRRVGKTFLIKHILSKTKEKYLFWNVEDLAVQESLKRRSVRNYSNLIQDSKLLVIDEAQIIPEIGMVLKLFVDSFDDLKIIATGSSTFDLTKIAGEPLVGRKFDILLLPLSEIELLSNETPIERTDNLRVRMVYGNMPEILNTSNDGEKRDYLKELVGSYLIKDILAFENVKNSSKILDLLKLIAYQVGREVSLEELGRQLSISKNTVEKYLDLLSKVFVIHKLSGFSRNLRKEVTKHSKWYFFDNGIRNTIINNFNPVGQRDDIGALWKNYVISERLKFQNYNRLYSNNYFWRTYDQQEIDWVEEREGKLFAYEFKWKDQKLKIPKAWEKAYPNSEFNLIHQDNYFDWVTE